jgi:hypothetical protein
MDDYSDDSDAAFEAEFAKLMLSKRVYDICCVDAECSPDCHATVVTTSRQREGCCYEGRR